MEDGQETLRGELELVDTDLGFLFLIVLSVLLSYLATVRERDGLCLRLRGEEQAAQKAENVAPLRLAASALVVGSLGFFFMQALDACRNADPVDETARRSARLNLIASFLVLLASLIRLLNFNMVRRAQPALDDTLPPA